MSRKNEGISPVEIKQNVNMKLKEWLVLAMHGRFAEEVDVKNLTRPNMVGQNVVPEDLNGLTFGQLLALAEAQSERDIFLIPCRVLFGMKEKDILNCRAVDVVRFSSWVAREVKRIGMLFDKCHNEPRPQEVKAGIHRLNFGIFGVVDWYARRMGVTDHEDVERVPWVRVYKCMQMDAETEAFNRRLNEIYKRENERRRKR